MRQTRSVLAVMGALLCAGRAYSQQPGMAGRPPQGPAPQQRERGPRPPMSGEGGMEIGPDGQRAGPPEPLASHLLSHVGELKLTDQQVTKLAAIARRADERHRAMRITMDSMARLAAPLTAGSAPRAPDAMHAAMERAREMERGDVRDALALLTVDQQADAWIMRGAAGGRPHPGNPWRGERR
jgi:hypothetical protein